MRKADKIIRLFRTGMRYKRIAEEVGTTPGNVQVTIHRLRRKGYRLPPRRRPRLLIKKRGGIK